MNYTFISCIFNVSELKTIRNNNALRLPIVYIVHFQTYRNAVYC